MSLVIILQVDEEECSARETKPENSVKCSKNDCDTWEVKHNKQLLPRKIQKKNVKNERFRPFI